MSVLSVLSVVSVVDYEIAEKFLEPVGELYDCYCFSRSDELVFLDDLSICRG
jgi:hypothetical protein